MGAILATSFEATRLVCLPGRRHSTRPYAAVYHFGKIENKSHSESEGREEEEEEEEENRGFEAEEGEEKGRGGGSAERVLSEFRVQCQELCGLGL